MRIDCLDVLEWSVTIRDVPSKVANATTGLRLFDGYSFKTSGRKFSSSLGVHSYDVKYNKLTLLVNVGKKKGPRIILESSEIKPST